jgi:hypothetical protein
MINPETNEVGQSNKYDHPGRTRSPMLMDNISSSRLNKITQLISMTNISHKISQADE